MKKVLLVLFGIAVGAGVVACIVLFFALGPSLNQKQCETLGILGIVCAAAALNRNSRIRIS